jgi:uncharacterized protein YggE
MTKRTCLMACLLAGLVLLLTACGSGERTVLVEGEQADGIHVTATQKVSVKPDKATITLGVYTRAKTARQAQADNAQVMQKVADAVKRFGLNDDAIQTTGYSVYPSYTGRSVVNYDVTNTIRFELTDLAKAGELLDAAADAGANTNVSIAFGLKDADKAYGQALTLAVKEARIKAEAIASAAGRGLGDALRVEESGPDTPVPYYADYRTAEDSAKSVPVSPGTLDVSATVTIVYAWR